MPYDVWHREGHLLTTPGRAVEYEYVARELYEFDQTHNWQKCAFDRWAFKHLRPWLLKAGFTEERLEELKAGRQSALADQAQLATADPEEAERIADVYAARLRELKES